MHLLHPLRNTHKKTHTHKQLIGSHCF